MAFEAWGCIRPHSSNGSSSVYRQQLLPHGARPRTHLWPYPPQAQCGGGVQRGQLVAVRAPRQRNDGGVTRLAAPEPGPLVGVPVAKHLAGGSPVERQSTEARKLVGYLENIVSDSWFRGRGVGVDVLRCGPAPHVKEQHGPRHPC